MIKNKDIICISSIDWDFVWQGHQEIMSAFAKAGNRVLFIENTGIRAPNFSDMTRLKKRVIAWFKSARGFRKEAENLYVYSPLILPFPYSRLAHWFNRRLLTRPIRNWMKVMGFSRPVVWTFLPTRTALDIADRVDRSFLVYYCIANFYELADDSRKVKRTEDELIKRSDIVFAQGDALYDKCRASNSNVHIFPFGVNIEIFDKMSSGSSSMPAELKNIKRPIIGYIGGIHKHIDFGLLEYIGRHHPEWSLVLVGPIQTDISRLAGFKNIFFLGKKDISELPLYIKEFSVGIIPYAKSEYTATVYPTKLNEYHALGKPVVSTDLPEVENFNRRNGHLVGLASTPQEFCRRIVQAMQEDSPALSQARVVSAENNNWSSRINQMSDLMEDAIRKLEAQPDHWREKFVKLYRVSRRKIMKLTLIAAAAYLVVFYTPLAWFVSSPLKMAQPPQKADCIVVFAGGVGESGQAGQGYEERVQYAAELYKSGYAAHIIFSSGYSYVFSEPMVMKALAVSLGVPQDAITLEDKAANTMQNVEFTRDIMLSRNWHKALLVSSPYHMRRVSLVMKKNASAIEVIYTPILHSRFYSRENSDGTRTWKQISLKQIEGLMHEYAGIVYYYFKGYI